jgi:hypothetical protein
LLVTQTERRCPLQVAGASKPGIDDVVFKRIFGGGEEKKEHEFDVDDLIVLERYAEAEGRLRSRLATHPHDLHAHLRLADVYVATGQSGKAVEEFAFAADEYADDGFFEKGIALLAKALKLVPNDPALGDRLRELEEKKLLEHRRTLAIEGLLTGFGAAASRSSNALIEAQQLWLHLADTRIVKRLPGDQLKRLFAATRLLKLSSRQFVVEAGATQPRLYLVVRGGIEALFEAETRLTTLRTFGPGDVFGEQALFENRPWSGTYRTTETTSLLVLERAGLETALQGNPDPRDLLDALREQHNDREVGATVERLRAAS